MGNSFGEIWFRIYLTTRRSWVRKSYLHTRSPLAKPMDPKTVDKYRFGCGKILHSVIVLIWCRKPIINYSVCIKYHHVNTTNWYMHQLAYICIGGFTMHLLWFLICLLDYNNPIGNTRAKRGKRHRCLDLEFAEVEGRKRESKVTKDLCLKLWILNLWWWKKERIIGKGV